MDAVLQSLVDMSRTLGNPEQPFAILGEGNCSARIDDETFYVKQSGTTMADAHEGSQIKVRFDVLLNMLESDGVDDDDVARGLQEAVVEEGDNRKPSVEAVLHALLLKIPEYAFIGHTHPMYTNMILCSKQAEELCNVRLFPDQIVSNGPKSVYVPYVDPGLVLAREVRSCLYRFIEEEGELPKVILMQNHGLITMGASPKEVTSGTQMAEKSAEILVGTFAMGGPNPMPDHHIARIHTRPDEQFRQKTIANIQGK